MLRLIRSFLEVVILAALLSRCAGVPLWGSTEIHLDLKVDGGIGVSPTPVPSSPTPTATPTPTQSPTAISPTATPVPAMEIHVEMNDVRVGGNTNIIIQAGNTGCCQAVPTVKNPPLVVTATPVPTCIPSPECTCPK